MKRKRVKVKVRPISGAAKPPFEECWYCELNADPGAEAKIVLSKFEDGFQYFDSEPEQRKRIVTQVEIPRCVECQIAHDKVGDLFWKIMLFCFAGVVILGVYLGIFTEALSWWTYLLIGLALSGAVIGIAIGTSRNLFTLPKNIKKLDDVEDQSQVQALLLKGWKFK